MFNKKTSAHEEDAVELTSIQLTHVAGGKGINIDNISDLTDGLIGDRDNTNSLLSDVTGLIGSVKKGRGNKGINLGGNGINLGGGNLDDGDFSF
ncbi:hypothetical protein EPA93_34925 [Ktedonosporobacter rubrisoli]|uniref:Uncharacterized protein n=1 Tax=Ktedonosporobacter rubrisoli TaxID=2509675 RepID=A0A4P6K0G2_KTERU|nr:hypothetical protein [Ktedonosporobacter rubrisoli]QBD80886.1 hypothetical protein EPA93_34925 [Ktedonosporobacter rubrisoli]